MRFKKVHSWNVSPEEAISIQNSLKLKVVKEGDPRPFNFVAGADVSTTKDDDIGYAAVVVMSYPDLNIVEVKTSKKKISFPYIPGLLSFRETPILMEAFESLETEPDIILVDGQGIAHPRRFGIASHIGVLLDKPVIGVAKSRLVGTYDDPDMEAGSFSFLYDSGEVVGAVVRTKTGVNPVFVSVGHKISLEASIDIVRDLVRGYRIPEPTRVAHIEVNRFRRGGGKQLSLF